MTRRVYDYISPLFCCEEGVGNINGNIFLPLLFKVVHYICELKLPAHGFAYPFYLLKLFRGQRACIMEKPAHQRAFAMVNMTNNYYMQGSLFLVRGSWFVVHKAHLFLNEFLVLSSLFVVLGSWFIKHTF